MRQEDKQPWNPDAILIVGETVPNRIVSAAETYRACAKANFAIKKLLCGAL